MCSGPAQKNGYCTGPLRKRPNKIAVACYLRSKHLTQHKWVIKPLVLRLNDYF